jgi:methionine-S-sulfoxide reductase
MQEIVLGAGCFWGVEQRFFETEGVSDTEVGYCGGVTKNPSYKDVCSGDTGHAEVVRVIFDESVIELDMLLNIFWDCHNPTTKNRQGPDIGSQYRSAIFYSDEDQQQIAIESLKSHQNKLDKKIVTEIVKLDKFYPAEDYHQKYFQKNSNHFCGI